jgi:Dna[CI] antecedent, DciA
MKAVAVCAPRSVSELAEEEAGMESARAGFQKIVAEILRRASPDDAVSVAWEIACGRTVAEKTEVIEFRDGVLRVRVPDEAWRSNLAGFVPRYVELLNTMLRKKVQRIELVALSKTPQKKAAPPER